MTTDGRPRGLEVVGGRAEVIAREGAARRDGVVATRSRDRASGVGGVEECVAHT